MTTDRKVDKVVDAIKQMSKVIFKLIVGSVKGDLFEKAFECLTMLRETCVTEDEAQRFNDFLEKIKLDHSSKGKSDFFHSQIVKN